jgi:hypothetical protein
MVGIDRMVLRISITTNLLHGRYAEDFADLDHQNVTELGVAWNCRAFVLRWVVPPGMTSTLPQ